MPPRRRIEATKPLLTLRSKALDAALFRSKCDLEALKAHQVKYESLSAEEKEKHGSVVNFHPLLDWESCGLGLDSDWSDLTTEVRGRERRLCKLKGIKENATEPACSAIYFELWGDDWDADYVDVMDKYARWPNLQPAKVIIRSANGTQAVTVEVLLKGMVKAANEIYKRFFEHFRAQERLSYQVLTGFDRVALNEYGVLCLEDSIWEYEE